VGLGNGGGVPLNRGYLLASVGQLGQKASQRLDRRG